MKIQKMTKEDFLKVPERESFDACRYAKLDKQNGEYPFIFFAKGGEVEWLTERKLSRH